MLKMVWFASETGQEARCLVSLYLRVAGDLLAFHQAETYTFSSRDQSRRAAMKRNRSGPYKPSDGSFRHVACAKFILDIAVACSPFFGAILRFSRELFS